MPEKQLVSVLTLFYHRDLPRFAFTGHWRLFSRLTPHDQASGATCRPPGARQPMSDVADGLRRLVVNRTGNRCEYCRLS